MENQVQLDDQETNNFRRKIAELDIVIENLFEQMANGITLDELVQLVSFWKHGKSITFEPVSMKTPSSVSGLSVQVEADGSYIVCYDCDSSYFGQVRQILHELIHIFAGDADCKKPVAFRRQGKLDLWEQHIELLAYRIEQFLITDPERKHASAWQNGRG